MLRYRLDIWKVECRNDSGLEAAKEDPKEWSGFRLDRLSDNLNDVHLCFCTSTFIKSVDNDNPLSDFLPDGRVAERNDEQVVKLVRQ